MCTLPEWMQCFLDEPEYSWFAGRTILSGVKTPQVSGPVRSVFGWSARLVRVSCCTNVEPRLCRSALSHAFVPSMTTSVGGGVGVRAACCRVKSTRNRSKSLSSVTHGAGSFSWLGAPSFDGSRTASVFSSLIAREITVVAFVSPSSSNPSMRATASSSSPYSSPSLSLPSSTSLNSGSDATSSNTSPMVVFQYCPPCFPSLVLRSTSTHRNNSLTKYQPIIDGPERCLLQRGMNSLAGIRYGLNTPPQGTSHVAMMKETASEAYGVVDVASPRRLGDDTDGSTSSSSAFRDSPSSGLSPRRAARAAQQQHHHLQKPLAATRSEDDDDDDDDDAFDMDAYDSDGKPPALKRMGSADGAVEDARLRVNGIVVDYEIRGGAKLHWEDVYQVLFKSSTPNGQRMALTLLIMVSISVTCAVLDSVKTIRNQVGDYLLVLEVFFTVVFTIEYTLRVLCLRKPRAFVLSLVGIVDLSALVPSYLGLFIPSARPLLHLAVLRVFRVMRVFRVLRLARFVDASAALSDSIQSNKRRIAVFLVALFTMILVIGCAMYLIEGDHDDFSNIPISLYWTVVTITTVGYGDIAPQTVLGRMLATVVMFAGYGLIACPLVLTNQPGSNDVLLEVTECPRCFRRKHQDDANFCRVCGTALHQPRAKTIKAQQRRLRLAKLRTPVHANSMEPMSSTTSTTKSNVRLLNPDEEEDRHGITVNL